MTDETDDDRIRRLFREALEGLPILESERAQCAEDLRRRTVDILLTQCSQNLAARVEELMELEEEELPPGEIHEGPPADPTAPPPLAETPPAGPV